MDHIVTTDAQRVPINFLSVQKQISDGLTSQDVKALKFLCSDFISLRTMEKINSAFQLFDELKKLRMISPPDDILCIAELLFCIQQRRLMSKLPYALEDVQQIVDQGKGHLKPCRVLLYRISEHITKRTFEDLCHFCPTITRSMMEKIKDPLDLFLALQRQNIINVNIQDLNFLRQILSDVDLSEEVDRIDKFLNGERNKSSNVLSSTSPFSHSTRPPDPQNISRNIILTRNIETRPQFETTSSNETGLGTRSSNISSPQQGFNLSRPVSRADLEQSSLCALSIAQTCTEGASGDTLCSRQSSNASETENSDHYYKMTREPRGICVIINNTQFHGVKALDDRKGSDIDCNLLVDIFKTKLKFEVRVFRNLTDEEIVGQLNEIAALDHSDYDCFVCFILSHGDEGLVYGANAKTVSFKQITGCFVPSKCRGLTNKPKLFFIQACQGKDYQAACDVQTDSKIESSEVEHVPAGISPPRESIPGSADFYLCLSTVPGYVSFRSLSRGTWFITTLVKMLDQHASSDDLKSIITRVNYEISRAEQTNRDGRICKQVAMDINTLRKKVKFC